MPGNVTVGLNGSPESFAAVKWAAKEAVLREVALRIVHVQEWPVPPEHVKHIATRPPFNDHPTKPRTSSRYEGLLEVATAEAESAHPGLTVSAENVSGAGLASKALLAEAGTPGSTDLLVLGSQGLDRFTGFVIGTTSLPVAAASPCPVVLVRGWKTAGGKQEPLIKHPPGQLLLGIDIRGTEDYETLLEFGFSEAARRHCRLRILHAWALPPTYAPAQTADPGLGNELAGRIVQALEQVVEPWRQRFQEVTAQTGVVMGAPGAELVYASSEADLVIVGRRERSLPVGPRLGHVTHAVIHHAASPVAIVPHP
ncbi:universal stress protein [Streptomyces sp. NPDC019826]|uniref:Universal stress protein n=1 Tax=[Kitasatospora] papulosa TaxID=1464011 RepID=A0ABZ1K0X0_9ACTN|nr:MULTISPECIES: universal stress protein [Streptomyces]MDF6060492.1 universal stress protein [Streptomyces sp. JH010]